MNDGRVFVNVMPAKKESKINLLPQKEFEGTILGKTLKWALSSFRIIVIVTEMVVMGAFLSRFWLDAQNSDLNETITQKQAIIQSFKTVEKNFRDTQKRLLVINKLTSPTPYSEYVKTTVSFLPPEVNLKSVSKSENTFQIMGSSGSEQGVAQFITNLESSNQFKEVTLTQIDSNKDNESLIIFTLRATLKET